MNPEPEHAAYFAAIGRADKQLQEQLAAIRAQQDVGELTVRMAADARIAALEAHLAECRSLRQRYLDG